ncbi:MAG: HlyD family efflux transporter periplasmic adaptor subunit [Desulfamplus sp.]|nr:HlyD family efflux transporter periplasmic adaptor subunit [Desulfamplus sp.]
MADEQETQNLNKGEWHVEKALKEVELRGYTRSIRSATISSEVSGRVVKVNYEIGDSLNAELENSNASSSKSNLNLNPNLKPFAEIDSVFVNFDIQSTRIAIAKIKTQLKQMDSRIAYLKKEFRRKEELFTKGRATEVIRDAASQELEQAILEREAVRQGEQSLGVTLNQLLEKKNRHTIFGLSDWVVTDRKVEAGEMIQAGMPLGVIQDFRQLVVPLAVSNEELEAIRGKGETFEAILENQRVMASIYYVNPGFNEQTRKTDIKILIKSDDQNNIESDNKNNENDNNKNYNKTKKSDNKINSFEQRGGLIFVLPVSVRSKGLRVPAEAIQNRYENPKVYVKGKNEPVMITILDRAGDFVTIAENPELPPGTLLSAPPLQEESFFKIDLSTETEPPKTDSPVTESSKADPPVTESSKADPPAKESSKTDSPAKESSKTDSPAKKE